MELTKDEKKLIKALLERQLDELKGEEVKKDAPLTFFEAEQEYEKFLNNILRKFR